MSRKYSQERPTNTLRLSFFSTSPTTPSGTTQRWIVSSKVTAASETTRRNARFYRECDCACK
jgi:hypothetical protein